MILRLASGSSTPASKSRKRFRGIHVDEIRVHLVLEHVDDLLGLALTHEAVVHMHADELLAHRLDEQGCHHRGVDAARERQQHVLVADLFAARSHLLVDERLRELGGVDARHVVGTLVRKIHGCAPCSWRDG